MDRIIEILQKEYDRVEYAMKLGKSIGKENAPEYKQLEKELAETGEAIKILQANANTGDSGLHLQRVSVAKHPLPRPLECWNKARELDCGDYIEWHLKKERGNAR